MSFVLLNVTKMFNFTLLAVKKVKIKVKKNSKHHIKNLQKGSD